MSNMELLTPEQIDAELEALKAKARRRMKDHNPLLSSEASSELDFMTPEERERSYLLIQMLPSYAEEARAARKRLRKRIADRRAAKGEMARD